MAEQIKPVYVAIGHIYKTIEALSAENKAYIAGQLIFAVDEQGKLGLKIGDWEFETQPYEAATPFNDLGWFIAPEAAGSAKLNCFAIRNTDPQYDPFDANDDYPDGGCVISDERLEGKADYAVFCTQFGGGELRDEMLQYNTPAEGKITIKGLQLGDGEKLRFIFSMALDAAPDISALDARVRKVEYYNRPFSTAGGGAIWIWKRPINQIPEGWREVIDYAGKFIMGRWQDHYVMGDTGGSNTHTNSLEEQFPHDHDIPGGYRTLDGEVIFGAAGGGGRMGGGTKTAKSGGIDNGHGVMVPKPYSVLNEYKVATYIEPDPDYIIA